MITSLAESGEGAGLHNIDELAKAIARELLHALRQSGAIEAVAKQGQEDGVFLVGRLTVDTFRHEATYEGQPLNLKPREFALLAFLAKNSGRAFSREQLLEFVWPADIASGIECDRL